MDKIKNIFKNIFINTYKVKDIRDIFWFTRLIMILILSLIIAFLSNLYIYSFMKQNLYIIFVVIGCIISYYISFYIVCKEYQHYKKIKINKKYPLIYLVFEAIIAAIILIYLFLYIQSFYI